MYNITPPLQHCHKTLDPAAAQIWRTYGVLATIATAEGRSQEAATCRRQAREAWLGWPMAWTEVRPQASLIAEVLMAVVDPAQRPALEGTLNVWNTRGWGNLVAAIRRVLAGERDPDGLCAVLDWGDTRIILIILQGLDHPDALGDLFGQAAEEEPPPAS